MCRSFLPEILISADRHKPKTFKISEDEYASVFRWMEEKREKFLRLVARNSWIRRPGTDASYVSFILVQPENGGRSSLRIVDF